MNLPPTVTERAFARLAEIGAAQDGKALRVAVDGGGCSGFQYEIDLDTPPDPNIKTDIFFLKYLQKAL